MIPLLSQDLGAQVMPRSARASVGAGGLSLQRPTQTETTLVSNWSPLDWVAVEELNFSYHKRLTEIYGK